MASSYHTEQCRYRAFLSSYKVQLGSYNLEYRKSPRHQYEKNKQLKHNTTQQTKKSNTQEWGFQRKASTYGPIGKNVHSQQTMVKYTM